jgi:hypothetical protein
MCSLAGWAGRNRACLSLCNTVMLFAGPGLEVAVCEVLLRAWLGFSSRQFQGSQARESSGFGQRRPRHEIVAVKFTGAAALRSICTLWPAGIYARVITTGWSRTNDARESRSVGREEIVLEGGFWRSVSVAPFASQPVHVICSLDPYVSMIHINMYENDTQYR